MPGVDVLVLGVDHLLRRLNNLITRLRGLVDLLSRAGDDPCGAGLTERAVNDQYMHVCHTQRNMSFVTIKEKSEKS